MDIAEKETSPGITELVNTRREVEQLEHRLELILNSVGDGIYGLDLDGQITFVNRAAERMLGWKAGRLIGKSQQVITRHTQLGRPALSSNGSTIHAALREGITSRVNDEVFWHRDGTRFPVEYTCAPVEDQAAIVGAVVTFRDITTRQQHLQAAHELRAAHALQQQLYPAAAPSLGGFDIAGAVFPAALACGDYYDFIPETDETLVIAVGDVSGHGLGPALQMIEVRAYLRAILSAEQDIEAVVTRLNHFLFGDTPEGSFVSLFLAQLDASNRSLRFLGAGHDARLLRSDGSVEQLESSGLVLGIVPHALYQHPASVQLRSGDLVCIVTDGVTEALSQQKELFGDERLLEAVDSHRHQPAEEIIRALYERVTDFAEGRAWEDDVTVVILKSL